MEIEIEFISSDVLRDKQGDEKTKFILNKIKKDKILVIDGRLLPHEETMLIEKTMSTIDEKFRGIEVSSLKEESAGGIRERIIRMLGGKTGGLTVIGPSKLIKKVKQEPQKILLFAGKDEEKKKDAP